MQSSRFRNRKINFKTNISIYVGTLELPFDDDQGSASFNPNSLAVIHDGSLPPGFSTNEAGEVIRIETGVDKEEEGEHHLQVVISASAAALTRSRGPTLAKSITAHIPTPDATGIVSNYTDYYKHNVYVDPRSYVRSSDTVEDTMGIAYTMDETDADFLDEYNHTLKANYRHPNGSSSGPPPSPSTNGFDASYPIRPDVSLVADNGHYPSINYGNGMKRSPSRKDKGKSTDLSPLAISEDDFELVMDLFERTTDRKTPTLHMVLFSVSNLLTRLIMLSAQDVSRIPSLEDLEPYFSMYIPQNLMEPVKNFVRIVYPHWKERRLKTGGKNIVPQLDVRANIQSIHGCNANFICSSMRPMRRHMCVSAVAKSSLLVKLGGRIRKP